MSTDAIVVEFEVRCSPAHAFDLWTSQISTWWPHGHRPSGDESSRITIEPGDGGPQRTRTQSEAAFQADFVNMLGNVPTFLAMIGLSAGIAVVLLVRVFSGG